jgi:hypothetical protein
VCLTFLKSPTHRYELRVASGETASLAAARETGRQIALLYAPSAKPPPGALPRLVEACILFGLSTDSDGAPSRLPFFEVTHPLAVRVVDAGIARALTRLAGQASRPLGPSRRDEQWAAFFGVGGQLAAVAGEVAPRTTAGGGGGGGGAILDGDEEEQIDEAERRRRRGDDVLDMLDSDDENADANADKSAGANADKNGSAGGDADVDTDAAGDKITPSKRTRGQPDAGSDGDGPSPEKRTRRSTRT